MSQEKNLKYIASTIVRANDIALNGNLFGGTLLRWLDEYGALFTYKYLHHTFVTYRMGDTYFLKSAKLGNLIDFYVTNVEYKKLSVSFDLIAKINDNNNTTEIINTNMTFVAIDINTEKPVILNPELFELSEFKDCIYQKYKKPHPTITLEKGNSKSDYKKKYLALLYLDLCDNNPAEAIMKFQKDWGKIFSTSFITDTISYINS